MPDALRRTFAVVFAEPWTLFGVVFLVQLPLTLLAAGWALAMTYQDEIGSNLADLIVASRDLQLPLGLVVRFLAQATVIVIVFAHLRGEEASAWEGLRTGLARFLPLLALSLLIVMAFGVGAILFLVPGIIVYTCSFVAIPALLVEGGGVGESWRRSFVLTRGYRWQVFGVVFVTWLIGFTIGSLSIFVLVFLVEDPVGYVSLATGFHLLGELTGTVLGAVAAAVVYHDLRLSKEGLGEGELLAVFA